MAENEDTHSTKQKLKDGKEGTESKEKDHDETHDNIEVGGEDLNATMMSIDISQLEKQSLNQTEIKIQAPTDEEIIQEQLEQKKSPIIRFLSKLTKRKSSKTDKSFEWPSFLKPYVNIWICDSTASIIDKAVFYVTRALILVLSVYLHILITKQVMHISSTGHPAKTIFLIGFIIELVLVTASIILKLSPGWIVSLPLGFGALTFSYGIYFYHTADPLIFSFHGKSLSQVLNNFYLLLFTYSSIVSLLFLVRKTVSRILFGLIYLLCFVSSIIIIYQKIDLEFSFFGVGFLSGLSAFYLQPIFILFHVLMPILFFITVGFAFGSSQTLAQKNRHGFARSLSFLLMLTLVTNFAIMQKNRIPHIFNLFVPLKLNVGAVEMDIFNQSLRVETKNYKAYGGSDEIARYIMSLKRGQKDNQFLLQVVDEFNYPVKNLSKDDIVIYSDNEQIKNFKFKEEDIINFKKGNYIIDLNLTAKKPLISWDAAKAHYFDSDSIEFTISNPEEIGKIQIKEGDETILEVIKPKESNFTLPLFYFEVGTYDIEILAFDASNQEIFRGKQRMNIDSKTDLRLLSPLPDDTVGANLPILIMPVKIESKDIESFTYKIDEKVVYESTDMVYYQGIDISELQDGQHILTVTLNQKSNPITKTVVFIKNSSAPKLMITKPAMGTYALRQTELQYQLEDGSPVKIVGIKVSVNGTEFKDYEVKENLFTLPVSHWAQSEMFVTVQATLDNGERLSDWVQINKGLGQLDLSFDEEGLKFLNYKHIAIVLDATVSFLDNWQGKEKWRSIKKLMNESDIDDKIKGLDPEFIIFGDKKPQYYKDCEDVDILIRSGSYNRSLLKRKITNIKPTGVSALNSSLVKAYLAKPEKIFIFTDSSDACQGNVAHVIRKQIDANLKTQIVIFAIGQIRNDDKQELQDLAENTGGRFYQPDNYDNLQKMFLRELVLNYELFSNNDLLKSEPLGSRKFRLVPGVYTLKIPLQTQTKEVPFEIENTTKTTLSVTGEDNKIHVNISKSRL